MKKINIKDNWGSWTVNEEPISKYLGETIQQGSTTGVLRFSHSSRYRGHGASIDIQHFVLVTEDYRLVRLKSGVATLVGV